MNAVVVLGLGSRLVMVDPSNGLTTDMPFKELLSSSLIDNWSIVGYIMD